jgi:hypothetical protein
MTSSRDWQVVLESRPDALSQPVGSCLGGCGDRGRCRETVADGVCHAWEVVPGLAVGGGAVVPTDGLCRDCWLCWWLVPRRRGAVRLGGCDVVASLAMVTCGVPRMVLCVMLASAGPELIPPPPNSCLHAAALFSAGFWSAAVVTQPFQSSRCRGMLNAGCESEAAAREADPVSQTRLRHCCRTGAVPNTDAPSLRPIPLLDLFGC